MGDAKTEAGDDRIRCGAGVEDDGFTQDEHQGDCQESLQERVHIGPRESVSGPSQIASILCRYIAPGQTMERSSCRRLSEIVRASCIAF